MFGLDSLSIRPAWTASLAIDSVRVYYNVMQFMQIYANLCKFMNFLIGGVRFEEGKQAGIIFPVQWNMDQRKPQGAFRESVQGYSYQ